MTREPMSGTWRGWWRQGLREGHEALSLAIAGSLIRGSGQDEDKAEATAYEEGPLSVEVDHEHLVLVQPFDPARRSRS